MGNGNLWKYCTASQWQDYLLSLHLSGRMLSLEKELAVLYHFSNRQEEHYRKARIPKRSGGFRTLRIPDRELAGIQRRLLSLVLETMAPSPYAMAYRKGVGLKAGGEIHRGRPMVIKMDIRDFFGSIGWLMVYQRAFPAELFPEPVRGLFTGLCCFRETLPQGAPTSPYLSNLVMKSFDYSMGDWCRKREISYTRYCDDLTFSGDMEPGEVIRKAGSFLETMGFSVNTRKTRVFTRAARQEVTGLVVNEKVQLPAGYRRRLRQEWYYCRKFGVEEHLKKIGSKETSEKYLERLLGKVGYVLAVDPENREFREIRKELLRLR